MSGQPTANPNRCAPSGWRPLRDDDESRKLAAGAMAHDLSTWLQRSTGRPWDSDMTVSLLLHASPAGTDLDGYSLARNFEKFGINPDTDLVDILEEWSEVLDAATLKREQEELIRLRIEAPFSNSAAARFHAPEGKPICGTAFRIHSDRLGRCAFVPDENALDESTGALCVLLVGLEDVEIIGPARSSADSLHVSALAAADTYENKDLMQRLGHQADLDIGMFDADVADMVAAREAVGSSPLSAHLELISHLIESSKEAMENDDATRIWVASLLCAATARRVAMLSGEIPDAVTTRDVVTSLSAPPEDDTENSVLRRPTPAARMH